MILLTKEQTDSFKSFLEAHDSFLVAGHKEPDGDCIASSLGISYILKHLNKPHLLLNAGPFKRTEIKKYAGLFTKNIPFMTKQESEKCGLIIVDCSETQRLGELEGEQGSSISGLDTFIVDHHKTADTSKPNTIIDSTCPAAALLVQQLYESIVGKPSKEEADTLFFGISTDTGFFRYLNEKDGEVFNAASRLVGSGTSPRRTYQEMTGGKPWNTRKLLGIMLDRAELHCNGKLVTTYEKIEDTHKYGQDGRDSDALYTLMLAVEGVEAVLFLRQETEENCTAGFRSLDKCDVSAIASKFGGGGHKNASGASIQGRIETLLPAIIKEFSKVL
ncbi:MAG: bifunctional oligoribonuclease/PAP phosphatase NrnA [Treponema sp.]|nr:bifunctional oligoribonuclease/PAP phosphatase NrnA [Treponema sp.]MBR4387082.1 bifunctional oligoribonuclease/PAP phosphatase NrnA [Treponema sp.]